MRTLLAMAATALVVTLAGSSPAAATPLSLETQPVAPSAATDVQAVGYYHRRHYSYGYGYRSYNYYPRSYGYYSAPSFAFSLGRHHRHYRHH